MNTNSRVGILLVHGVGEQGRFEHLDWVVRNIAQALKEVESVQQVHVEVRTSANAPLDAKQIAWVANDDAPVVIEVTQKTEDGLRITELYFSEAWWADLDEPITLSNFLSFVRWGLSLWTKPRYIDNPLEGAKKMTLPNYGGDLGSPKVSLIDRVRLFGAALIMILLFPLFSLLRPSFRFNLPVQIFAQYFGDVKLLDQSEYEVKDPPLSDLDHPPRVSIRRRVVQALVKMRLRDYDRWYVMAHSLGSVLALNGLMETEEALPNYLSKDLWEKWQSRFKASSKQTSAAPEVMMPSRPPGLEPNDIISRKELFHNLKGFMTYGSPLSKYAVLWPWLTPLNKDESVFDQNFEWINFYDPSDPIADRTKYFFSESSNLSPKNIVYRTAWSFHLLSHINYLTFWSGKSNLLVSHVASWLLTEDKFQSPKPGSSIRWPNRFWVQVYIGLRILLWWVIGSLVSVLLSYLVPKAARVFNNAPEWLLPLLPNPLVYIGAAVLIVLIVGTTNAILRRVIPAKNILFTRIWRFLIDLPESLSNQAP